MAELALCFLMPATDLPRVNDLKEFLVLALKLVFTFGFLMTTPVDVFSPVT